MSGTIINLILQLISGVVGGHATGSAAKTVSLGPLGNTIAGALGGLGGGAILTQIVPMLMNGGAGGMDLNAIAAQLGGGVVGGAVLTAIAGAVKNMMGGQKTGV